MFNLFKRKPKQTFFREKLELTGAEFDFLRNVVESLPVKYHFLKKQITSEFIKGKAVNDFDTPGGYGLFLDQEMEKKIRRPKPYYCLGGIKVLNKQKNAFEYILLDILDEVLIGFNFPSPVEEYDLNSISLELIYEKQPKQNAYSKVEDILGKDNFKTIQNYINFYNVFDIELDNSIFYTIHDFGEGNYLAINDTGEIFGLFHDPYKVEKIYTDIKKFIEDLTNKQFSPEEYKRSSKG